MWRSLARRAHEVANAIGRDGISPGLLMAVQGHIDAAPKAHIPLSNKVRPDAEPQVVAWASSFKMAWEQRSARWVTSLEKGSQTSRQRSSKPLPRRSAPLSVGKQSARPRARRPWRQPPRDWLTGGSSPQRAGVRASFETFCAMTKCSMKRTHSSNLMARPLSPAESSYRATSVSPWPTRLQLTRKPRNGRPCGRRPAITSNPFLKAAWHHWPPSCPRAFLWLQRVSSLEPPLRLTTWRLVPSLAFLQAAS